MEACTKQQQSHQNKFHAATLRHLTLRFATIREGDAVSAADKELWEYFASLYKHSNKGIKGRGKDRRIFSVSRSQDDMKHEGSDTSLSSHGDEIQDISSSGPDYDDPMQQPAPGNWTG